MPQPHLYCFFSKVIYGMVKKIHKDPTLEDKTEKA